MATILHLETATTVCSVSLAKDGHLLALKEQFGTYSHAENLTLFVENVLKQAHLKLSDIDAIAVSKGPGSYTGLRIGVSTAKGLCYALDKPLIAINTLQAMFFSIDQQPTTNNQYPRLFCPMLDARRMEVYCAIYDSSNICVRETSADIIDEHSFSDLLEKNQLLFFGDGAAKCRSVLAHNKNTIFIDDIFPSAKNMITLSEEAFAKKQFEDLAYFEPFYLKDFVAGKKKGE